MTCQHSRKNSAVVSHDDFVQNGENDAPVDVDLLGSRAEHLKEEELSSNKTE